MSANPPNQQSPGHLSHERRTSSFVSGLLKRTKSSDILRERRSSDAKNRAKIESEQEEALRRQRDMSSPPTLPGLPQQPQIQTFGGENHRPAPADTPPVPPIPAEHIDQHARTQSMTHRGRYSYAPSTISSLNSPRRVRRRKDPTPYNILIIGARNSGKTSFLNFLKSSLAQSHRPRHTNIAESDPPPPSSKQNHSFTHHYVEIENASERIGVTLWDSQGLDKGLVDLQLREISNFVESKFDDTFLEETKVLRSPGLRDTHIHCCFLILDPQRLDSNLKNAQNLSQSLSGSTYAAAATGALDDDFDIQVIKMLQGKTTVIPVISKADTVTTSRMAYLKRKVVESLQKAGIDPLEALNFEVEDTDDEGLNGDNDASDEIDSNKVGTTAENGAVKEGTPSADSSEPATSESVVADNVATTSARQLGHKRESSTLTISSDLINKGFLPFSILNPDEDYADERDGPVGRSFVWGFADPYNPLHCDFVKLKDACFVDWRGDLREASREIFYERWRTSRLNRKTALPDKPQPTQRKSSGGIPIILDPVQPGYRAARG